MNLILVRTCIRGRLFTYRSMYRFIFFDGRFDRPGVIPRCRREIRIVWCLWVVLLETQVR